LSSGLKSRRGERAYQSSGGGSAVLAARSAWAASRARRRTSAISAGCGGGSDPATEIAAAACAESARADRARADSPAAAPAVVPVLGSFRFFGTRHVSPAPRRGAFPGGDDHSMWSGSRSGALVDHHSGSRTGRGGMGTEKPREATRNGWLYVDNRRREASARSRSRGRSRAGAPVCEIEWELSGFLRALARVNPMILIPARAGKTRAGHDWCQSGSSGTVTAWRPLAGSPRGRSHSSASSGPSSRDAVRARAIASSSG
jgi:hypothetical protein